MSIFLSPVAPKLRDQELAASFVSRLAAWLRYTTARLFCADFNLDFELISSGDFSQLTALAALTQTNVNDLSLGPVKWGRMFSVDGQMLSTAYLDRVDLWICPECVAEDMAAAPHLTAEASIAVRRDNVVKAIGSCSKHHRRYAFVGRSEWRHGRHDTSMTTSDIPAQLSRLEQNSSPVVPSMIDTFVWQRFADVPDALAHMPLHQVLKLAGHFGNWAKTGGSANLRKMSRLQLNETFSAGLELLLGGEEQITKELDRQLTETNFARAAPVRQALSKVRRMLTDNRSEAAFVTLNQTVNAAVAKSSYSVSSRSAAIAGWSPLNALAKELGYANYVMKSFAQLAGANHPTKAGWANAGKLHEWLESDGGLVPVWQAGRDAGLTEGQLSILLDSHRLVPVVPRLEKRGSYTWLRRGHVDAMLESCLQNAPEVLETPEGKTNIKGMVRRATGTFLALHDAITSGKLSVHRLTGHRPYASILIDIEEASQLLADANAASDDMTDVLLTRAEFSRALGIGSDAGHGLTGPNGLVRTVDQRNPRTGLNRKMVPSAEVEKFRRQFVKSSEVATLMKAKPKDVLPRLKKLGILPVDLGGVAITLFQRSDLSKIR